MSFSSKSLLLAALVLGVLVSTSLAYNPRLKDLAEISEKELDRVLADDLELKFYTDCVLDKGSCDRSGRAIKETLADMQHSHDVCHQCNEVQRSRAVKILKTLQDKPVYDEILRYYGLVLRK